MPTDTIRLEQGPVVAVGSFDGVHLGHQQILSRARALARESGTILGVATFDPLPAQLIYPEFTYVLTPLAEKTRLLTGFGVELVHVIRFDDTVRNTAPDEFIRRHIVEALRPSAVVVGHDHRFGQAGAGDAALLGKLLARAGTHLEVVPEFTLDGVPVRSTGIREQLLLGAVAPAARLLGRFYAIAGAVVSGSGTGRRLGFPTVNLRPAERESLVPADGVYVAQVELPDQRFDAVLNIGHRPTFGGETRTIEAHLLDFPGGTAPDRATFHFVERIRPERRFASPAELAAQIAADITTARRFVGSSKP
jgi:riboflavin kinase/FMN adenylyltransferase